MMNYFEEDLERAHDFKPEAGRPPREAFEQSKMRKLRRKCHGWQGTSS